MNEIENRKKIELIKLKVGSLERSNTDKLLPRWTKGKKRKKTQITKTRNKNGGIITNSIEI